MFMIELYWWFCWVLCSLWIYPRIGSTLVSDLPSSRICPRLGSALVSDLPSSRIYPRLGSKCIVFHYSQCRGLPKTFWTFCNLLWVLIPMCQCQCMNSANVWTLSIGFKQCVSCVSEWNKCVQNMRYPSAVHTFSQTSWPNIWSATAFDCRSTHLSQFIIATGYTDDFITFKSFDSPLHLLSLFLLSQFMINPHHKLPHFRYLPKRRQKPMI